MKLAWLFRQHLPRATRDWADQGLISPDQARAICQRYGLDDTDRQSKGYWLLVMLGYLFLGLALITLVSANWDQIPRGMRMAGLILATLAIQALGIRQLIRGKLLSAQGVFFLGSLVYGAAIMLIAQIYHLGEHYPDGCLIWALGVLPLALILQSRALMLLTAVLAAVWAGLEAHLGYFPWLFPLFLGAMTWHLLRAGSCQVLFGLLVLFNGLYAELALSWLLGSWDNLELTLENLFFAAGYGMVCHSLSRCMEGSDRADFRDYGTTLDAWLLRLLLLTLVILSFESPWEALIAEPWKTPGPALTLAGIMTLAALAAVWKKKGQTRFISFGLALIYLFTMAALITLSDGDTAIWFAVADNFLLIASGIWLIWSGIRNTRSREFFLGVCVILLTGLVRYMDLVGDYVGTTLLFAGFAVILLAAARFWKKRVCLTPDQGDQP